MRRQRIMLSYVIFIHIRFHYKLTIAAMIFVSECCIGWDGDSVPSDKTFSVHMLVKTTDTLLRQEIMDQTRRFDKQTTSNWG